MLALIDVFILLIPFCICQKITLFKIDSCLAYQKELIQLKIFQNKVAETDKLNTVCKNHYHSKFTIDASIY